MRTIDADALILHLTICQYNGLPTSKFYTIDDVIHYVKTMPTIEPQRKTGKWINVTNDESLDEEYECSVCGYELFYSNPTKYCPNCGSYNGGDKDDQR